MDNYTKIPKKASTHKSADTKAKKQPKTPHSTKLKLEDGLPVIRSNCAGIDIGAKEIFVAAPVNKGEIEVRIFGVTTPELNRIVKWFKSLNITSAAMEATGIYWVPLYEMLGENKITPCLIDPKSVKNVPGRNKKTDALDCKWIQRLFSCGLLRPAYLPKQEWLPFRNLLRQRGNLVQQRAKHILWMHKSLIQMNIRLDVVLSETSSVTGENIMRAIVAGERDPSKLVKLRNSRCHKNNIDFVEALTGNFKDEHLFNLERTLRAYDALGDELKTYDLRLQAELKKFPTIAKNPMPKTEKDKRKHSKYARAQKPKSNEFTFDMRSELYRVTGIDLLAVPGIGETTAAVIISELGGADVSAFDNEKNFCSWLAVCPGQNISGGKNRSGKSRKSQNRIKQALLMSSSGICNSNSALGVRGRNFKTKLGKAKGQKATAHMLARLVYRMIKHGEAYVEEGEAVRNEKLEQMRIKRFKKQAEKLGYRLEEVLELVPGKS